VDRNILPGISRRTSGIDKNRRHRMSQPGGTAGMIEHFVFACLK
jgi:hypothetical protein